jgi:hypothetical protein
MFIISSFSAFENTLQFMLVFNVWMPNMGTAVPQWLRYFATNRKVAGSVPDGVVGFFR